MTYRACNPNQNTFNMSLTLQQLAICIHLDNILVDKQDRLSALEQKFKAEFKSVADAALFPGCSNCLSPSHNQYKITYSKNFRNFYKTFKQVLTEYSLMAPECEKIQFQDVPSIMKVISHFDTNYHRMCRPHTNPIPTL